MQKISALESFICQATRIRHWRREVAFCDRQMAPRASGICHSYRSSLVRSLLADCLIRGFQLERAVAEDEQGRHQDKRVPPLQTPENRV
jgi:hypothetical protein